MEFLASNIYFFSVILILIGFFIGLKMRPRFSSRVMGDKSRAKTEQESTAFLKGINYLLSNDHDQAIEEFTKAVQINSNTVETYIALGNLFRSKGEVGRAIRIHESIILRPTVDRETKVQALYNLGLDFKKAGFIKRAISSLEDVIGQDPHRLDAYIQLEELYEEIKNWEKTYMIQERISTLRKTKDNNIKAHLLTELGKSCFLGNDERPAEKYFKKAISLDANCIDAFLHLGDLYYAKKSYNRAVSVWKKVLRTAPPMTHLVYGRLEKAYCEKNKSRDFEKMLRKISEEDRGNSYVRLALAECLYKSGKIEESIKELRFVIKINPTSLDARKKLGRILVKQGSDDELISEYRELLEVLDIPEKKFRCQKCGFVSESIHWKCPQCLKWDTIIPKESEPDRDINNTEWKQLEGQQSDQ